MSSNDPFPKSVIFTGAAEMAGKSGMEGRGGNVRVLKGREEVGNCEEYELRPVKQGNVIGIVSLGIRKSDNYKIWQSKNQ